MSKEIGLDLPNDVQAAFDGTLSLDRVGLGYVLMTVDVDGRPRPSMLSHGEVLAVSDRELRVGMWPKSRTGANLASGRRTCLCYVAPGVVYYVHGSGRLLASDGRLEVFALDVELVESDIHEGLPVQGPITYACEEVTPEKLLQDWSEQLAQIRNA